MIDRGFRPPRILLPSDLASGEARNLGRTLSVAGRLLHRDEESVTLTDAYAALRVFGTPQASMSTGDFVSCEVTRDGDLWRLLEVESVIPSPEPHGQGDVVRLSSTRARRLVLSSRTRSALRSFFEENHFIEVATPTLTPCPGLDSHVHSLGSVSVNGHRRYLSTSPEFAMKRLLTSGMGRIYQFARCYRAEENGRWHEPEFTMLEWYRAHARWDETIQDTEELVRRAFAAARADGWESAPRLTSEPFARIRISDAFRRFAGESDALVVAEQDEDRFFGLLVEKVEPALADLEQPTFLTHYPISQAALARPCAEEPGTAERYELYFRGVELCNGFGELTDANEQRARFRAEQRRRQAAGEEVYPLDERFLDALVEGMPACSGNALGLDRLVAVACGASRLVDVLPFGADEI